MIVMQFFIGLATAGIFTVIFCSNPSRACSVSDSKTGISDTPHRLEQRQIRHCSRSM